MNSHGGKRPGAGRPSVSLDQLIASGTFNARNQRHRRKLREGVISGEGAFFEELRYWQARPSCERRFAAVVAAGPDAVEMTTPKYLEWLRECERQRNERNRRLREERAHRPAAAEGAGVIHVGTLVAERA